MPTSRSRTARTSDRPDQPANRPTVSRGPLSPAPALVPEHVVRDPAPALVDPVVEFEPERDLDVKPEPKTEPDVVRVVEPVVVRNAEPDAPEAPEPDPDNYPVIYYNPRVPSERFYVGGSAHPVRFTSGRFAARNAGEEQAVRAALRRFGPIAADRWRGDDMRKEWVSKGGDFRTRNENAKDDYQLYHDN